MAVYSIDFELTSGQYAWAGDSVSLSITGDISVEIWLKMEQRPSDATTAFGLVGKYNYTDGKRNYLLQIRNTDILEFLFSGDGSGTTSFRADNAFVSGDVGVWMHLAVSVDVSVPSCVMYKNGSVFAHSDERTGETAIQDTDAPLLIGAVGSVATHTSFMDGKLKNVRLWNDIRSEAEFDDNKCKENSEFTPGVGNYLDGWSFENT